MTNETSGEQPKVRRRLYLDYVFMVNDSTFVIAENLRCRVSATECQTAGCEPHTCCSLRPRTRCYLRRLDPAQAFYHGHRCVTTIRSRVRDIQMRSSCMPGRPHEYHTTMTCGHRLVARTKDHTVFNSGAAGYILSRATLHMLRAAWGHDTNCIAPESSKWLQNNPGHTH